MTDYSYLYDEKFHREQIEEEHFVSKEISYVSHKNAYIVPSKKDGTGVYTENREQLGCTGINICDWVSKPVDKIIPEKYVNETVIYLGVFIGCWGHALTDVITRLWFLKSKIYEEKFKNCRIMFANFASNDKGDTTGNIYKLFEILGLEKSRVNVLKDTIQCSEVIIPDGCFFMDGIHRYITSELIDLMNGDVKYRYVKAKKME